MKNKGSGNVTGLKLENIVLALKLALVVQSKAPYYQPIEPARGKYLDG